MVVEIEGKFLEKLIWCFKKLIYLLIKNSLNDWYFCCDMWIYLVFDWYMKLSVNCCDIEC